MTVEAGVLVNLYGQPIFWHYPPNRSIVSLPDSRDLWDVIWENRERVKGFAHSHPGSGMPGPSYEDVTTFSGVEKALGRRLVWWITSSDYLVNIIWLGPDKYDYRVTPNIHQPAWLGELRRLSCYEPFSSFWKPEAAK